MKVFDITLEKYPTGYGWKFWEVGGNEYVVSKIFPTEKEAQEWFEENVLLGTPRRFPKQIKGEFLVENDHLEQGREDDHEGS